MVNFKINKLHFFLIAIAIVILDRLSKLSIITNFSLNETMSIFSFLSFTRVHNFGVAWGALQGKGIISILVSILVLLLIYINLEKIFKMQNYVILGISLILGGALGNLIDRLVYGYVIDFIDFHWWPVFNIADIALVIGAVLFILQKESIHKEITNKKLKN